MGQILFSDGKIKVGKNITDGQLFSLSNTHIRGISDTRLVKFLENALDKRKRQKRYMA